MNAPHEYPVCFVIDGALVEVLSRSMHTNCTGYRAYIDHAILLGK